MQVLPQGVKVLNLMDCDRQTGCQVRKQEIPGGRAVVACAVDQSCYPPDHLVDRLCG
jgi:hypothetical protein